MHVKLALDFWILIIWLEAIDDLSVHIHLPKGFWNVLIVSLIAPFEDIPT